MLGYTNLVPGLAEVTLCTGNESAEPQGKTISLATSKVYLSLGLCFPITVAVPILHRISCYCVFLNCPIRGFFFVGTSLNKAQ